jgi:hypothetical protein
MFFDRVEVLVVDFDRSIVLPSADCPMGTYPKYFGGSNKYKRYPNRLLAGRFLGNLRYASYLEHLRFVKVCSQRPEDCRASVCSISMVSCTGSTCFAFYIAHESWLQTCTCTQTALCACGTCADSGRPGLLSGRVLRISCSSSMPRH